MSGDEKNIVVDRGIPQSSCCSSTATPQPVSTIQVVASLQQTKPSSTYFPSGPPDGLELEQHLPTISGDQNNSIDASGTVGRDAEIAAAELAQARWTSEQAALQAFEAARRVAERQAKDAAFERAQQIAMDAQTKAKARVAAEQSKNFEEHKKHFKAANQLWLAVGTRNPSLPAPSALLDKAAEAGKRIFIRRATASLGRYLPVLAVLYPSDLASGERPSHILATSASDLGVTDADLEFISSKTGTIEVTHRLLPDATSHNGQFRWVKTDGVKVGKKVRVRPVTYDAHTNTYNFTRDGETTPSLIWTPQERPENSSTSLPADSLDLTAYPGTETSHQVPQADLHPEHTAEPDDYILSRPAELGGGSLYIVFKDPREISGVAKGKGVPVSGTWLGESTRNEGAPIPSQIADLLRGRSFSNFDRMRKAMWEAVARDPELRAQFSKLNVSLMEEGNAPYSKPQDQSGGRKKFEIHHKHEIAQGGEVYDFSNLVIMTPIQHIQHHKGKNHDEF